MHPHLLASASLLLLAPLAASPSAAPARAAGAFQPAVVFTAKKVAGGPTELYAADASGQELVKLSGSLVAGGNVVFFRWSPNRKLVAFTADKDTDDAFELYVVPAAGGEPVKVSGALPPGGDVEKFLFAWAANSARIAYRADQGANQVLELFVASADGESNLKVSGPLVTGGSVEEFEWAKNGKWIAYRADQHVDGAYELFVATADATKNTKVSVPLSAGQSVEAFRWAPNGARLAYRADDDGDGGADLFVTSPDGAKSARVSEGLIAGASVDAFAWSPKSTSLAFRADGDTDAVYEIYVASADGKKRVRVNGPFGPDSDVVPDRWGWAPTGKWIAYGADATVDGVVELYAATPDGKKRLKVSGPLVAGGSVEAFSWHPKGTRLAYVADQDSDEDLELYGASIDGKPWVALSAPLAPGADVDAAAPLWPKTGARVSYLVRDSGGIPRALRAAKPDGSTDEALSGALVPAGDVADYLWDSKGKFAVYMADQDVGGQYELYLAAPGGVPPVKVSGPTGANATGVSFFAVR